MVYWRACGFLVLVLGFFTAAAIACNVPDPIQGQWDIRDSTGTQVEHTIDISTSGLSGISFWDKTLSYDCFFQQGNYYVFRSETTSLFDQYNVQLYFCWYLQPYENKYLLYELTDKVLYTIEERAKAFLNTTDPSVSEVCEIVFQTSLTYKEMEISAATF